MTPDDETPRKRCDFAHVPIEWDDDETGCPLCAVKAQLYAVDKERNDALLDIATLGRILSNRLVARIF
jgi:hypothetical protein